MSSSSPGASTGQRQLPADDRADRGTAAALAAVTARATVVGVDSDRLYPLHQQESLARALGVPVDVVTSERGHDGFLVETEQVGAVLRRALAE